VIDLDPQTTAGIGATGEARKRPRCSCLRFPDWARCSKPPPRGRGPAIIDTPGKSNGRTDTAAKPPTSFMPIQPQLYDIGNARSLKDGVDMPEIHPPPCWSIVRGTGKAPHRNPRGRDRAGLRRLPVVIFPRRSW